MISIPRGAIEVHRTKRLPPAPTYTIGGKEMKAVWVDVTTCEDVLRSSEFRVYWPCIPFERV